MARTQREMKLRNARPEVNTQTALAMARASAGSRNPHAVGGVAKHKVIYERPKLRVVERPRKLVGFRISNKIFLAYVIGFLALFAAVVMRAEMAATQLKLNSLNSQLSSLQTQHQRLEVQLSGLESPGRIVSYAESHLGMVYPTQVGYLGAVPNVPSSQNSSTQVTPQVISAPNTLFAPPGEAGGGAPTRPLVVSSTATTAATAAGPAKSSATAPVASSSGSSSHSPASSPKTG